MSGGSIAPQIRASASGNIAGVGAANTAGVAVDTGGQPGVWLKVTGPFIGTLGVYASFEPGDNPSFTTGPLAVQAPAAAAGSALLSATITAAGEYWVPTLGAARIGVRGTAWTSGTANVTLTTMATVPPRRTLSWQMTLNGGAAAVGGSAAANTFTSVGNGVPVAGDYIVPAGYELHLTSMTMGGWFYIALVTGGVWGNLCVGLAVRSDGAAFTGGTQGAAILTSGYGGSQANSTAPHVSFASWTPQQPHICQPGSRVGLWVITTQSAHPNTNHGYITATGRLVPVDY